MAVPTVTSISPVVGLPSGRLRLKVEGTNFALPVIPPGNATGDWHRSVRATLDGELSEAAIPYSDTLLWVVTPPYYGDPSALPAVVDLTVENLDVDGNPVPGESVTVADAFTYQREDLTAEGDMVHIVRSLRQHLQRNLIENVSISADPDYSDDPAAAIMAIGELPAVVLLGPTVTEDRWRRTQDADDSRLQASLGGYDYARDVPPWWFVMSFRIWLMSDSKRETINLLNLAARFFHKRWRFPVETSPGSGNRIELELRVDESSWEPIDDLENKVHRFENTLLVEECNTSDSYGVTTTGTALEDQPVATESGGEDEVPVLEVSDEVT